MKKTVKVILQPEPEQIKILIDTIDMYSDLCNFISNRLFKVYTTEPINKHYLNLLERSDDLHKIVHGKFPNIDFHMIQLAFNKVTKYYKYRDTPSDAYVFGGELDYNSYLLIIEPDFTQPNNIGRLTIKTFSGPQKMNFLFNGAKREKLSEVFRGRMIPYREYILSYNNDKFYLSTIFKEEMPIIIKPYDPFHQRNRRRSTKYKFL